MNRNRFHLHLVSLIFFATFFLGHSNAHGQIVARPQWAGSDGRLTEVDQFHFDDAAAVDPWLDGRAAFFGQRLLAVTSIAKVQKKLGLDEGQKKRIKDTYVDSVALAKDANDKLGKEYLANAGRLMKKEIDRKQYDTLQEKAREECRRRYREIDAASGELISNVLKKEQFQRLKELVFQIDVLQFGFAKAAEIRIDELKLEDADIERIKLEANKQDAEFKKTSKQLLTKKREKLLAVLTPKQRLTLKKLQGAPANLSKRIVDK